MSFPINEEHGTDRSNHGREYDPDIGGNVRLDGVEGHNPSHHGGSELSFTSVLD